MKDEEEGVLPNRESYSPDSPTVPDLNPHPAPQGDFQRVDAEPMEPDGARPTRGLATPGGVRVFFSSVSSGNQLNMPKPPVLSTWIFLILAWMFLGSRVPFTVFAGLPLNAVALVLALVCLGRGGLGTGMLVLILGTAGSLIVYLVGLFRFLAFV